LNSQQLCALEFSIFFLDQTIKEVMIWKMMEKKLLKVFNRILNKTFFPPALEEFETWSKKSTGHSDLRRPRSGFRVRDILIGRKF